MSFTQHEWLGMFSALNSEARFNTLIHLSNEESVKFNDLIKKMEEWYPNKLDKRGLNGWAIYHLNMMMAAEIINRIVTPVAEEDPFVITPKGEKVLMILMED